MFFIAILTLHNAVLDSIQLWRFKVRNTSLPEFAYPVQHRYYTTVKPHFLWYDCSVIVDCYKENK